MDALQTQCALTTRKERELHHKSSLLRSQRVLLEHNFEAVTERQRQLSDKETDLGTLQHQLVGKIAEIKKREVVLSQREKVLTQRKALFHAKIAEIRENRSKTESVKGAIADRIDQAKHLLTQLQEEERELGIRQLKLSQRDKELSNLQGFLASQAAEMATRWKKYEEYQQDLELERRSQALQRLRASLASRESQLRTQICLYEENHLQLQALNSHLQQEKQSLNTSESYLTQKCSKLKGKRDKLEIILQRYETAKTDLERLKAKKVDQIPIEYQLNAELQQTKTANFDLERKISDMKKEQEEKEAAATELSASIPDRQAELQTRGAALETKKAALQGQKKRVMQLEMEVAQLAEIEGCMDGEVQRLLYSAEDWKRKHANELHMIRECMERIQMKEQRVQGKQARSPLRSSRS
jgi:chromosome segregation ATPase